VPLCSRGPRVRVRPDRLIKGPPRPAHAHAPEQSNTSWHRQPDWRTKTSPRQLTIACASVRECPPTWLGWSVGRFFTSFDEAWQYFLGRAEPLECFFGDFPEDEAFVAEGWVVVPPSEIKQAALELQGAFASLEWLTPVPEHFLHAWLGGATSAGGWPHELRHSGAFDAVYQRVNCFHSAVVVEVEALQLPELIAGTQVDASTFLPHMTIGVTREEHDPRELRTALLPLRNAELGGGKVTELTRIRFPAAQTTLLQPWTVIESVPLSQNG
jgi:hypothetical protein